MQARSDLICDMNYGRCQILDLIWKQYGLICVSMVRSVISLHSRYTSSINQHPLQSEFNWCFTTQPEISLQGHRWPLPSYLGWQVPSHPHVSYLRQFEPSRAGAPTYLEIVPQCVYALHLSLFHFLQPAALGEVGVEQTHLQHLGTLNLYLQVSRWKTAAKGKCTVNANNVGNKLVGVRASALICDEFQQHASCQGRSRSTFSQNTGMSIQGMLIHN